MILPGDDLEGVAEILEALAGRPLNPYLDLLVRRGFLLIGLQLLAITEAVFTDSDNLRVVVLASTGVFIAVMVGESSV